MTRLVGSDEGRKSPESEAELLERARALSGRTLQEVAEWLRIPVPTHLRGNKGWIGQLLERALGATGSSRPLCDFTDLGIELKSIPVTERGRALESTFVCTIALDEIGNIEWQESRVKHKLSRVFWLPVEGERSLPPALRRIGTGFIWSPNQEQEAILRADWEELAGLIGCGAVEQVTGHTGRYLQIRPKARRGASRRTMHDERGLRVRTLPRGFYLRASFTTELLATQFGLV